ncbi:MAG: HigA family addiction module antitoxin [Nitrospinae bacterium]|nr:HigA family addiction module antitoxin [Nitrospinota bacterium]
MIGPANAYQPDYAVAPGTMLAERLEAHDMSYADFARRCGRSPKLISEIVAGKAPVEPETALQFEKVTGVAAHIWLGLESDYKLHRAQEVERRQAEKSTSWAKRFPVNFLVKHGVMDKTSSSAAAVSGLLAFFGVGSVEAWSVKYGAASVNYRHSPSFESDECALATWRRLSELEAEKQTCAEFNAARFKKSLGEIRKLSREPFGEAIRKAGDLCNESGVVLALVPPLPKAAISGAAWWLSSQKAVIALSARHKTDDHLWFTLFHEAAHILLHSKKDVFIDSKENGADEREAEANRWAADFLIPSEAWEIFVEAGPKSVRMLSRFAEEQGIAPGVVVGRLQYEGRLPWGHPLNKLKRRLEWVKAGS